MSDTIITVERLSKKYRLGQIGATTMRESVERWLAGIRNAKRDHRHETIDHRPKKGGPEQETSESTDGQITESSPSSGLKSNVYSLRSDPKDPQDPSDLWTLRDVSFEVKRGEVLGIIGRNGTGKSTMLKILSRITEPTSGRAIMRGRVGRLLELGAGSRVRTWLDSVLAIDSVSLCEL